MRKSKLRPETIAVHSGYTSEPTTKAVAVPIYQTVSYEFDSADHGAALFNLEVEGFRYSRINNPTVDVLEKRVAALEGGVAALAVASGQAALNFALVNLADHGGNIVSVPQLYGTSHTLLAHVLPRQGIQARFAESDNAAAIERLIDADTRAVFCETIGNPAGNICDIEALAQVAHRHGVPLIVDNTVATPILWRPIEHGADIVVHSLTKFMGGHGTTLGGAIVDSRQFPVGRAARAASRCSTSRTFPITASSMPSVSARARSSSAAAASISARPARCSRRIAPFCCCKASRPWRLRMERHVENARKVAEFLRADPRVAWVNYAASRTALITRWRRNISAARRRRC